MTDEQKSNLNNTLLSLQKKHGKEAISLFGKNRSLVERVPVSSMNLTQLFGGGYPRGRMIEIYGPESSGKTTLATFISAECQKHFFKDKNRNGVVAYIDVEHALDPDYAETFGLNVEDILFSQPNSAEQALDIVEELVESDVVDLIVIDSVAALTPEAEAHGGMGDQQMGLQARLMSKACRKLNAVLKPTSASIIWINQIREKIGVLYGNPECVAPDTLLQVDFAETQIPIESLFERAGVDWTKMNVNETVNVENLGVKVKSKNFKTGEDEFKTVRTLIRKEDTTAYEVINEGTVLFTCSGAHKIWDYNKRAFIKVEDSISEKITALSFDGNCIDLLLRKTSEITPILDMEVDGNHNYFANGVLSHNTTSGGNALKFYSSIRMTSRRKENIEDSGKIIGMISRIKTIKNKVAPPFKECEMKIIFGKGYQTEEEYVTAFVNYNLVEKGGSWFTAYKNGDKAEPLFKIQGIERVSAWFKENPDVFEEYKEKVQSIISGTAVVDEGIKEVSAEEEAKIIAEQERLEKEELSKGSIKGEKVELTRK